MFLCPKRLAFLYLEPLAREPYRLHLLLQDRTRMSRAKILIVYVGIDLLIVAGVVWCVFHRLPVRQYFLPAMVLFVLNGLWLVVMTVRKTPQKK